VRPAAGDGAADRDGAGGDPPEESAEELRDLLEQVYFDGKKVRRQLTKASEPL
jgi:hypothetical protein